MPPHFATLVMEIKVEILDLWVAQNSNLLRKGRAHRTFIAFLVDKIDNELWSV